MARRAVAALLIAAAFVGASAGWRRGAPDDALAPPVLAVVVHPGVRASALSVGQLRRIYLLREQHWADGARIAPVNLAPTNELREQFSRRVIGQSIQALASYWNDLYFHGTLPPPTVSSERAVLLYVARTPGAVGYVSRDSVAGSAVRVMLLIP